MKKKLATALFSIATALFADEALIEQPSAALPQIEVTPVVEKLSTTSSYGYVRLGVADNDAIHTVQTIPSLGIGYRYAVTSAVIDLSATYTREPGDANFSYTVPNISYLRYFSPAKEQSFYYGVGLAWGGMRQDGIDTFQGLIPSATVGYELNRDTSWRSFVQLVVSQPAVIVAAWDVYSVSNLPAPLAEVSFGLGF